MRRSEAEDRRDARRRKGQENASVSGNALEGHTRGDDKAACTLLPFLLGNHHEIPRIQLGMCQWGENRSDSRNDFSEHISTMSLLRE